MKTEWFQGILELIVEPIARRKAPNQKNRLKNDITVGVAIIMVQLTDTGIVADLHC